MLGYTTRNGKKRSSVKRISGEDVINYLHTGKLPTTKEVDQIIDSEKENEPVEEKMERNR